MRVIGWWSRHPVADYVAAGALLGSYRLARTAGLDPVVVQRGTYRVEIYQAGLGLSAAVFAFAMLPTAIVLALTPGRRLRYLLRNHPDDLRAATLAAAVASLGAMLLFTAALALDAGDASNTLVRYLSVGILVVEVSAAIRLLDLFLLLLLNNARDGESEDYEPTVGKVRRVPRPKARGTKVRVVETTSGKPPG